MTDTVGYLAEVAGFEPTSVGVKDRCLTAWLHLNIKPPFAIHSWETRLLLCSHPQMLVFHRRSPENTTQKQTSSEGSLLALRSLSRFTLSYKHYITSSRRKYEQNVNFKTKTVDYPLNVSSNKSCHILYPVPLVSAIVCHSADIFHNFLCQLDSPTARLRTALSHYLFLKP